MLNRCHLSVTNRTEDGERGRGNELGCPVLGSPPGPQGPRSPPASGSAGPMPCPALGPRLCAYAPHWGDPPCSLSSGVHPSSSIVPWTPSLALHTCAWALPSALPALQFWPKTVTSRKPSRLPLSPQPFLSISCLHVRPLCPYVCPVLGGHTRPGWVGAAGMCWGFGRGWREAPVPPGGFEFTHSPTAPLSSSQSMCRAGMTPRGTGGFP